MTLTLRGLRASIDPGPRQLVAITAPGAARIAGIARAVVLPVRGQGDDEQHREEWTGRYPGRGRRPADRALDQAQDGSDGLADSTLGASGFVATLQPDANLGRILAAYGGVFVAGSLAWGMALDGFRPDRYDITGALVCLAGVAVIMYAPREAQ